MDKGKLSVSYQITLFFLFFLLLGLLIGIEVFHFHLARRERELGVTLTKVSIMKR